MSILYRISDTTELTQITEAEIDRNAFKAAHIILVEIYSLAEFISADLGDTDIQDALIQLSNSHGSFADILPDCIIGSLAFPRRDDPTEDPLHFGYYLDKDRLVFIDDKDTCVRIFESLKVLPALSKVSTPRLLFEFMKEFIKEDPLFLDDIEDKLDDLEDNILEHHRAVNTEDLLSYRQILSHYDRYYQQLTDMASLISKDEYKAFTNDDRRLFRLFEQRADRLFQRAQYLKEYSLQLRELYQMQIDTQQNRTIQWLTVVTTLVVPLTLITSWYGMNFENMPELEWELGYFVLIGICVLLIIIELIFFKKRKWL